MALWHEAVVEKDGERWFLLLKGAEDEQFFDLHWEPAQGDSLKGECGFREGRSDEEIMELVRGGLAKAGWNFLQPFAAVPKLLAEPLAARGREFHRRFQEKLDGFLNGGRDPEGQ
ncbi:MAG: hypothetical protein LC772_09495 [Chloroflexi bacterium]|nr:hypothetical protein [Chloroflexota bacterium]